MVTDDGLTDSRMRFASPEPIDDAGDDDRCRLAGGVTVDGLCWCLSTGLAVL